MSDESSDCSDFEPRPSGSKSRPKARLRHSNGRAGGGGGGGDQKRKRRIVMRIEFDDSDDDDDEESSSGTDACSDENENAAHNLDERPSCSTTPRRGRDAAGAGADAGASGSKGPVRDDEGDDSDAFRRNASRRLRNRRANVLYGDGSNSDGSSSGSEIMRRVKSSTAKPLKNVIISEDDRSPRQEVQQQKVQQSADEAGFTSDSSSNELLEKCPICLLTFRQQEIGSPATCEHIFCANCIEAWSKNVQTCPIDRIEFERIVVRESYANRRIVREINVDSSKGQKGVEEENEDEDVTFCEICNSSDREDVMLLCDSCNQGYHMDCLSPRLVSIPEGSWYCDNCFDSQDEGEEDDVEEDLHMLYEDIRDMGIPEASLRVTEVHQPRILRTRQNERIRAAILRHTRSNVSRTETTTTTTTSTSTRRGRPRGTSTTTTTTTTTRKKGAGRKIRKRRRRQTRKRTYVVEYDLNNFDEKFAIKTTKKIIKRRRRKRRSHRARSALQSATGGRLTASQRLAEQLGVKKDPTFSSHLSGSSAGLSLFGSANDLEYFSDSDHDGIEHEIQLDTGHGTAMQTSVRISGFGSQRSRKGLLLGRLQRNPRALPTPTPVGSSSGDLLSSIMDMQDRWHNAARNLDSVHINADGTLKLPHANNNNSSDNNSNPSSCPPVASPSKESNATPPAQSVPNATGLVTQAPMYPHGSGNPNFNSGGGGGGNYNNNNRFNNQGGYHGGGGGGVGGGGGGGSNQYRHSTGGMMSAGSGGNLQNMVGRGNFNFSSPNYNPNQNSNNFSPFSIRFNQRNQQNNQRNNNNNNNQRNSLPFMNRNDQSHLQQPQQNSSFSQQLPQNANFQQQQQTANFNSPQLQNAPRDNNLFSGLPPPMASQLQNNQNDNQLFSGLPPPVAAPPQLTGPPPVLQHSQQQMLEARAVPPNAPVGLPPLMRIPPPPAPPPGVRIPWNNSLFQLNTDYGNDDDDSNCPNFSVYSAESQEVAKSSDLKQTQQDGEAPKEDDENEDLVQLDDDDDIPMPPETNSTTVENSDLYEPENPTEENDDEEKEPEPDNKESKTEDSESIVDAKKPDNVADNAQYNPEQETVSNSNETSNVEPEKLEQSFEDSKSTEETEAEVVQPHGEKNDERTPSPALSEIKLPESEASAANRKGVLELYDDSDWEELDIDKPKGYEKPSKEADKSQEESPSEVANDADEPDRSYTPCLDENNEPEEVEGVATEAKETATDSKAEDDGKTSKNENDSSGIAGMETELISDDEEESRGGKGAKRRNEKREKRQKGNVETFKKVSHKQKERNYRSDKQMTSKRKEKQHSSRSRSRSLSRSRSMSRSRSRSRSRSWFRSRSPRGRGRKRSRERSFRSRSRSNHKEYHKGRRGRRGGANSRRMHRQRPKRRELPRYDVRNVIGTQRSFKDRYGRDTSRQYRSRSMSRGHKAMSFSGSRSRSMSPKRNRRCSFSMSPSPAPVMNRRSVSPRRFYSPQRRTISPRRFSPMREHSRSPPRLRSRTLSPVHRMNGRKVTRHMRGGSPMPRLPVSRSPSLSASPRYTPRLYKSRSKSPHMRPKLKKKKAKDHKKKKTKKYAQRVSPEPIVRISRQGDPFAENKISKKKRRHSPKAKSPIEEPTWSPSPSPPPLMDYDNNVSWTPPLRSARMGDELHGIYPPETQRSDSKSSKRDKRKRNKKKKKAEKRRDVRKEKRRQRRTETPEPAPSKEVFASGNNILVSVSFNKEAANQQQPQPQQTTVVTLPPSREDLLTNRRTSVDGMTNSSSMTKKNKDKTHKRKKNDAKPIAFIDLDRSPFQVHQEPADIIVLTDSDDGQKEHERRRDRRHSESGGEEMERHRPPINNNARASSQHDKTPPMERLDTILEESYDMPQTGPKTPPEPPVVKFSIQTKKQNKVRNPLHDEVDMNSELEMPERQDQEPHRQDMDAMHVQSGQKIGPNTPPESGPCSPDVYDPFEPTKSPSLSPRSPTPPPLDVSQTSISDAGDGMSTQKHVADEQRLSGERSVQQMPGSSGNIGSQGSTLNPVELVMALMSSKPNSSQDMTNKSNESQFSTSAHLLSGAVGNAHDDGLNMRDNADDGNGITVLSNVLIAGSGTQQSQHIPVISSPTPMVKSTQILKLPLPKVGGSVGSSSGIGLPATSSNARNGGVDDSFNINDIESPYSPGSADYEDLFEPPPDTSSAKRRQKRGASGKSEVFDNLFGSTSPVGHGRLPYTPSSRKHKLQPLPLPGNKKSKIKVGRSTDEHIKIYDDLPNSAVELHVKDKFLRKLNRQERVVEEVKLILKPRFNKKQITKDDYKEIMRRAVPKICHSRSGEINPHKIKNLIEAYVKKFRAKHKKLNIINTGQVSSAVKCAAYLKKL